MESFFATAASSLASFSKAGFVGAGAPGAVFSLPVRYTEKTGSDVTTFLDSGEDALIAVRFDQSRHAVPKPGETVDIHFPRHRFDVFDAATERRL